jgi:Domain of unknwon function (DUF3824)
MFIAKKILCNIAIIGVLAVVPSMALADYRHDRRDDHGRRDDHRDLRRDDHRDYRRDDHRDYRPAPPPVCAPAPVVSAAPGPQAPVIVNVNVPPPAPVAVAPLGPDVISPSYKQWEVLYRSNPDAPWQISSEYSNRTDAEQAANHLEAQGYDTMLRLP